MSSGNRVVALLCFLSPLVLFADCSPDKKSGCTIAIASNYDPEAIIADNCACRYDGINSTYSRYEPQDMFIQPVVQETEVWCWLAVGEMIFKHFNLPNVNPAGDFQCGIVGAVGYAQGGACNNCNINCATCIRPAGSPETVSYMLTAYPKIASKQLYSSNTTLKATFVSQFLSPEQIVADLEAKRPVIAGINPGSQFVLPGNSQHVALIVGYYVFEGQLILLVNDPFPYYITGFDPYVFNGAYNRGNLSYDIPYVNFVNGLKWNTSWMGIGWQ